MMEKKASPLQKDKDERSEIVSQNEDSSVKIVCPLDEGIEDPKDDSEKNLMTSSYRNWGDDFEMQVAQEDYKNDVDEDVNAEIVTADNDFEIPVDRGWAWVVVLGCFGMHIVVIGGCKSFGVLYVEFQDKFEANAKALSAVISLPLGIMFALGIFGNTLAAQFSCRSVVFIGSIIASLGFLLTAFIPEFVGIVFTFGLLTGVGFCLSYGPCIIMVAHHFRKYRSLANGISIAGSGVGSFVIPNLMRVLLREYGLEGCLMIFSGIVLHVAIFAMLFRPFSSYPKKKTLRDVKRCSKNHSKEDLYSDIEKNSLITGGDKTISQNGNETSLCEWKENGTDSQSPCIGDGVESSQSMLPEKVKGTSQFLKTIRDEETLNPAGSFGDIYSISLQALNDLELSKTKNNKKKKDPVINGSNLKSDKRGNEKKKAIFSELKSRFDMTLLINPIFLLYAFSCVLATPGYANVFFMLPDYAENNGQDRDSAALITSIIGISDLVGRLFFGWFSDLNLIPKRWGFIGCMAVTGILDLIVPSLKSFSGMATYAAAFGFFGGSYITLIAVLLAEDLGLEKLATSFGLNTMFISMSIFGGPLICGSLKDATGSWDAAFYFGGVLILIGSCLPVFKPYCEKRMEAEAKKKNSSAM